MHPALEDLVMFKWVALAVAVVALAGFGWMLNDMRMDVKRAAEKADRLIEKTEALVDRTDKQLPRILAETDKATRQLAAHLPLILTQTETVTKTVNTQLPVLLVHSESAVDNLSELSDSFKQYKGLFGFLHHDKKNAS